MIRSSLVRPSRLAAASLALGAALTWAAPAAAQDRHVKFSGHTAAPRGASESVRANQTTQQQSGRIAGRSSGGGPIESGPGRLVLVGAIGNCRVGDRYRTVELRDGPDGSVTRLEGVQITACSSGTVSIDFATVAGSRSVQVIDE